VLRSECGGDDDDDEKVFRTSSLTKVVDIDQIFESLRRLFEVT
jgi:hypothetical protein